MSLSIKGFRYSIILLGGPSSTLKTHQNYLSLQMVHHIRFFLWGFFYILENSPFLQKFFQLKVKRYYRITSSRLTSFLQSVGCEPIYALSIYPADISSIFWKISVQNDDICWANLIFSKHNAIARFQLTPFTVLIDSTFELCSLDSYIFALLYSGIECVYFCIFISEVHMGENFPQCVD